MTAATFAACLAFTLKYEGGKADNPKDPGGRTNEGVTQRTYDAWLKKQGQTSRDVFAITPAERDVIYRTGFWLPIKGDRLAPGTALAVFDFGVNSGPSRALQAYGKCAGADDAATVKAVCAARLSFMHALGKLWSEFGRGWGARVASCEALGVMMAEHARIGVPLDTPAVPQVATTLKAEAVAATATAKRRQGAAAATTAVAGAAGTTQAPLSPGILHLPWTVVLATVLVAGTIIVLLAWRAAQHTARARAYAALAQPD